MADLDHLFATYFEWRVKPGCEEDFARLWSEGTKVLREAGSLGSALFQNGPLHFHAFARWPDRNTRDAAFALNLRPDIFDPFRACIDETLSWNDMELVENQWVAS